jgi:hypothetical protein
VIDDLVKDLEESGRSSTEELARNPFRVRKTKINNRASASGRLSNKSPPNYNFTSELTRWVRSSRGHDHYDLVFWTVIPCNLKIDRCFEVTYRIHLQGGKYAKQEIKRR